MQPTFYQVHAPQHMMHCFAIRRAVFIEEQGVDEELEIDGEDPNCVHFLGELNGQPIATLRIKTIGPTVKIQRVAVLKDYRDGYGVGRGIMEAALNWARDSGYEQAILGAQVTVIGFYEKLGFVTYGDQYEEAYIMHQDMSLEL
jgi:ElaA protein